MTAGSERPPPDVKAPAGGNGGRGVRQQSALDEAHPQDSTQ